MNMRMLRKLLGHDDKFYDLLEASAVEARASVKLLLQMVKQPDQIKNLDEVVHTKRKDKRITEQITEELCRTFVTPLEREDIEALSIALYRIPKTVGKFGERFLLCRDRVTDIDLSGQLAILEQTTDAVVAMVTKLRQRPTLDTMKEQNDRLRYLESQADRLMHDLVKDLYSGKYDSLRVIIILDLYELLERIIDRCRDAGNVILQIVLKYS